MSKSNKKIVVFLFVTFGMMYISHGVIALLISIFSIEWGVPLNLLSILGQASPALAALLVINKMCTKEEQNEYWKRVFLFKVPWFWWLVALASPLLVGLLANIVYHGRWFFPTLTMTDILAFPVIFGISIFAGGAEELGWRGILQDKLEPKINLISTGVIIGVLWGVWHAPLFLIRDLSHYDNAFFTYILSTVLFSLIMTLLVYKTKSVLLGILMHAGMNAFGRLGFRIPWEMNVALIVFFVVLIIIMSTILYKVDKSNNIFITQKNS